MAVADKPRLRCAVCGKTPEEFLIYRTLGAEQGQTAEQWVWHEEGTLDRETGHFLCDNCYIDVGMPSSPTGWTATTKNMEELMTALFSDVLDDQ